MTNYLPKPGATTKRGSVKLFCARLILIFAFAASTFHAPAVAHEEPVSHHTEHGESAAHSAMADHHGDEAPSHEGASDSLHHHHCPTALDARSADIALLAASAKALLSFDRANPLTSFSQAPPTEPPSA
jgi:hypothetical protein